MTDLVTIDVCQASLTLEYRMMPEEWLMILMLLTDPCLFRASAEGPHMSKEMKTYSSLNPLLA